MTSSTRFLISAAWLGTSVLAASNASAQQQAPNVQPNIQKYALARETSALGTVVTFTESLSDTHVVLQTGAGLLDAHLGNPRLLRNSHITLSPGENIRVIGENVKTVQGTQFLARILIKGNQQVALRSIRGIPFRYTRPATSAGQTTVPQGGVL